MEPGSGGGNLLTRPFGLRIIMTSVGLKPALGLRIIRPKIDSVAEFAIRAYELIVHYTE